ncbi:MAG: ABC transporter permease [Bacteroidia bacterium]|nr:ABC transporter permease [Bacteroidia bacterium]
MRGWLLFGGLCILLIGIAYFLPVQKNCILCAPSWKGSWLGTDPLGRDVGIRLLRAWGITLFISGGSSLVGVALGVILGTLAGSRAGWIDEFISFVAQAFWVVPTLLWAVVLAFLSGKTLLTLVGAIGLSIWTDTARLTRVEVRRLWRAPFVEAGQALGLDYFRLLWRHVLPNLRPVMHAQLLQTFATAALIEAGLGFVGLGPSAPHIGLGGLLFEAIQWLTLPQGQLQAFLAGGLLSGTVFAVYSLTGYGRNPF